MVEYARPSELTNLNHGFPEPRAVFVVSRGRGEEVEITLSEAERRLSEARRKLVKFRVSAGRSKKPGSGHPISLREKREVEKARKGEANKLELQISFLKGQRKQVLSSDPKNPLIIVVKGGHFEQVGGRELQPEEKEWREFLIHSGSTHLWGDPGLAFAREMFGLRRRIRHAVSSNVSKAEQELEGFRGKHLQDLMRLGKSEDFWRLFQGMQDFIDGKALGRI